MNNNQDLFLSTSDLEKLKLFEQVKRSKIVEKSNKDSLHAYKKLHFEIDDVNFRQMATQMKKSYGSIYNTYDSIVQDMKVILDNDDPTTQEIFTVDNDAYHYFLASRSDAFQFMSSILEDSCQSFEKFYKLRGNSKATSLRHLRAMRIFLKRFNVRISYEPMRLVGKETDIRLALGIMYWEATRGYTWPFKQLEEEPAVWLVKNGLKKFRYFITNKITFLFFANFAAVNCLRIYHGNIVEEDPRISYIHYPFQNVYEDFINSNTKSQFPDDEGFGKIIDCYLQLSASTMMHETYNLYNLVNCSLNDIPYSQDQSDDILAFLREYDTTIYNFIEQAIKSMPYNVQRRLNLSDENMKLLKINFIRVVIGGLAYGNSYHQMITFYSSEDLGMTSIGLPEYKKQIRNVFQHLVADEEFQDFEDKVTLLTDALYNVSLRLMVLSFKHFAVKIYPSIEESFFYYIDLIETLYNLPYVEFVNDPKDADLIVTTSARVLDENSSEGAYIFKWNHDNNSFQYGQLLGLIREIWTNEKISE